MAVDPPALAGIETLVFDTEGVCGVQEASLTTSRKIRTLIPVPWDR